MVGWRGFLLVGWVEVDIIYYTILYYTLLYYILYDTILYYTLTLYHILVYVVLRAMAGPGDRTQAVVCGLIVGGGVFCWRVGVEEDTIISACKHSVNRRCARPPHPMVLHGGL